MSAAPWMPFYVADYLGDTGHLSTVEHGAYLLLIMHYWQNRAVPTEDLKLARICRLTAEEWQEIKQTISDLFDENWTHHRIDDELRKADGMLAKRKAAGQAGASARYSKGKATAEQTNSHIPSPSPSPVATQQSRGEVSRETEKPVPRSSEWLDDLEETLRDAAGLTASPSPMLRNVSPIVRLLDAGYSLTGDIIPVLRACAAKGKAGSTWDYYVPAVTEGKAKGAKIAQKPPPAVVTPTVWIEADDPAFLPACALYERKTGRKAFAAGSRAGNAGIGFAFPVDCTPTTKEQAA